MIELQYQLKPEDYIQANYLQFQLFESEKDFQDFRSYLEVNIGHR